MFTRVYLGVFLLVSILLVPSGHERHARGQPSGTEEGTSSVEEAQMRTPPPVSGEAYSTAFASETSSK